jgi:hypothetical protein
MQGTTTTGQALQTTREWSNWLFIPGADGAPYKAQRERAGEEEGTRERLTLWFGPDPRAREPHTHPWPFVTTILVGGYCEERWTFREDFPGLFTLDTLDTHMRTAGDVIEVPAWSIHHVATVVPGTLTHMKMGKLTAGPRDWGHYTEDSKTGLWSYAPATASPAFLSALKQLNTAPV